MTKDSTEPAVVTTWDELEDRFISLLEFHEGLIEHIESCLAAVSNRDYPAFVAALRTYNASKPPRKFKVSVADDEDAPPPKGMVN